MKTNSLTTEPSMTHEWVDIIPETSDEGETVFAWFVMLGIKTISGGYSATESDALSDANYVSR